MRSKHLPLLAAMLVTALALFPTALLAQDGSPPVGPPVATSTAQTETAPPGASPAVPPPTTSPSQVAADTANAVRDAGETTVRTAGQGAEGVAEEGSRIFDEVLLPMWQRVASGFPSLIKAVLLLLAFWLIALLLAMAIRKLLELTKIDDRAARDWGLSDLLKTESGKPRSIAYLASRGVFWFVMLFGFVAFFQALDLDMVALPLQNVAGGILGFVPNLLGAAVILFAYWILASLARLALTKILVATDFDQRASRYWTTAEDDDGTRRPSVVLGRLAFYVILLFGIPPFLEALGQTALVTPLTDMLAKGLAFLPNIVAAVILFFIGKLVATIVREVVSSFLVAAGADKGAERLGAEKLLGDRRLSEIVGTITYFLILISVFVAVLDSLDIAAISGPVSATLERLLTATPLLLVAMVVLAIGWAIARTVRDLVASFLEGIGFDQYPARFGLAYLTPREGTTTLSSIVATAVMVLILLLTLEQALVTVGLAELGSMVGSLIAYLPQLLTGLAIVLVSIALGGVVGRLTREAMAGNAQAALAATVAQYAVVFLGVSMALSQLGVGDEIVLVVVAAVLFGGALALGLAFGLGGRAKAEEIVERLDI